MRIGVYGVFTAQTLGPGEVAKLTEDAGFDVLSIGEHTHFPRSVAEEQQADGTLSLEYTQLYDLFVALTVVATATTTLRLSSAIMQLAHRDPIITAKQAATLDVLSDGRLDLIVGHDWSAEQTANHRADFEQRYDIVRERILAMKQLFGADPVSFHGEHVDFTDVLCAPKPVQPGGVPLILGGFGPQAEQRALAYGDGWGLGPIPGAVERVATLTAEHPGFAVHAVAIEPDAAEIERWAQAGTTQLSLQLGPLYDRGEAQTKLEEFRRCVEVAVG